MYCLRTDKGGVREESGRSFVGPLRKQGVLSLGAVRPPLGSDSVAAVEVSARVLWMVVREASVDEGETVLVAVVAREIALGF